MGREDERRRGPERGWRREGGRWSSEGARRSVRGDDASGTEDCEDEDRRDETGYGNEWPEDYRHDFSGQMPQRFRDSYSERQSGPYRSPVSGRPVSEEQYRQEAHWHRSRPCTGFSGRVSEFGYKQDVENRIRVERPDAGEEDGSVPGREI